jgi:ankyrin repeat protein
MKKFKISSLLLGAFLMPVVSYGAVDFRPASLGTAGFGPETADFSGLDAQFAGVVVSDDALFEAIKAQNMDLVNYLLDHGTNVNARMKEVEHDYGGSFIHYLSPLVVAIRTRNIDMVRLLLQRGANVNTEGGNVNVPIYEAITHNYDVNVSPHGIVYHCHSQPNDIIRLLLEQEGIDVNVPQNVNMSCDQVDDLGLRGEPYNYQIPETALQCAGGQTQIVQLLLAHGAKY